MPSGKSSRNRWSDILCWFPAAKISTQLELRARYVALKFALSGSKHDRHAGCFTDFEGAPACKWRSQEARFTARGRSACLEREYEAERLGAIRAGGKLARASTGEHAPWIAQLAANPCDAIVNHKCAIHVCDRLRKRRIRPASFAWRQLKLQSPRPLISTPLAAAICAWCRVSTASHWTGWAVPSWFVSMYNSPPLRSC